MTTNGNKPRMLRRAWDSIFPSMPDFFGMLAEQAQHAAETVGIFVDFMETGDVEAGLSVRREEHEADRTKAINLSVLNASFATPCDREDLYRAIMDMDEVVNSCKALVREMEVFHLVPDPHLMAMARLLKDGMESLAAGFAKLSTAPATALEDANMAIKADRRIDKAYRAALADLFQGTDYLSMFKRREVYRHMSNAGDRLTAAAHALNDIVVKIG
jgi:hypothetical protein